MSSIFQGLILGSDHAGFERKAELILWLKSQYPKINIYDVGVASGDTPSDYPDQAKAAVLKYRSLPSNSQAAVALVLICGSGVGISMGANRFPEVRAVLAQSENIARLAREHNAANAICLGGRTQTQEESERILRAFLTTPSSKEDRHVRRIEKLSNLS